METFLFCAANCCLALAGADFSTMDLISIARLIPIFGTTKSAAVLQFVKRSFHLLVNQSDCDAHNKKLDQVEGGLHNNPG